MLLLLEWIGILVKWCLDIFAAVSNRGVFMTIQVHIEFTEEQDQIRLEGPPEDVEQAMKMLQDLVNDLVCCAIICPLTVCECRLCIVPVYLSWYQKSHWLRVIVGIVRCL